MKNFWILAIFLLFNSCSSLKQQASVHYVPQSPKQLVIDGNWDKPFWQDVEPIVIEKYMGDEPAHKPKVLSKVTWDGEALYIIFKVEDRYVRSVATKTQGEVWKDSCVEFFFTPYKELSDDYFNIEINCGGSVLFMWHPANAPVVPVSDEDCQKLQIAHSMPKVVNPEIQEPTTWTIEFKLPFTVVKKYCPDAIAPAQGSNWRANLYKCADDSSHPHWLTWSYIDNPTPKFHVPLSFGTLHFSR